jgi:fumarate hydratase, class II
VVILHGALKTLAVALNKLANDLRLLASGPQGGIGELLLPANEPGSSIMPGKVNPTQCEMLAMVCCQVIANDLAVTLGAAGGQLQLNTYRPLVAVNLLQSLRLLADAMRSFEAHALRGLNANEARIGALLRASLMSVTALAPHIGYDRAALIAATALEQRITLRDAALALGVARADFDCWTDPARLLGPS